ncbi:MAG: hypothetical protein EXX96DRAFT_576151 [Benjaminiella poitrasii]|nr:MAG: hypothetical protein EXX96DRAFT_576151 [Benjaminiella poitrasii]
MDSITTYYKCNNVYSTGTSPYFLVGAGNYITSNFKDNKEEYSTKIIANPEYYYPNACLFCGIPNGQLIQSLEDDMTLETDRESLSCHSCSKTEKYDSQANLVITAAPTAYSYSYPENDSHNSDESRANQNLLKNPLSVIIIHKQPYSQSRIFNKLASTTRWFHLMFESTRNFIIRKKLHFPVVTSTRKRVLMPSTFCLFKGRFFILLLSK